MKTAFEKPINIRSEVSPLPVLITLTATERKGILATTSHMAEIQNRAETKQWEPKSNELTYKLCFSVETKEY